MDEELKTYLGAMEQRLTESAKGMNTDLEQRLTQGAKVMNTALEQRLIERTRDMQTQSLDALEQRLIEQVRQMQTQALDALEHRLIEQMRDMQTELLRGFESFSAGQTIRLRKVEADQSNLDTALSGRVSVVEARLLQIELRLGKQL